MRPKRYPYSGKQKRSIAQAMKALELAQSLLLESISRRKRLTELELNRAISRIEKCSVQAADLDVRVHQYEHSEV